MNRRKERFVETFVTVMFPVALLVACTTNGNEAKVNDNYANSSVFNYAEFANKEGFRKTALPFGSPQQNPSRDNDITSEQWSILKGNDDKYVMVAPSLHLAIFTPSADDVEDGDQVQIVKYNEVPDFAMPGKYIYHFNSDDYNIKTDDIVSLKEHAEFLIRNPNFTLTISGHTDHTGPEIYNQKLSEQRAQLIADVLVTYGAPQQQLIVDGYGESIPVSEESLDENRRVELEYSQSLLLSAM